MTNKLRPIILGPEFSFDSITLNTDAHEKAEFYHGKTSSLPLTPILLRICNIQKSLNRNFKKILKHLQTKKVGRNTRGKFKRINNYILIMEILHMNCDHILVSNSKQLELILVSMSCNYFSLQYFLEICTMSTTLEIHAVRELLQPNCDIIYSIKMY